MIDESIQDSLVMFVRAPGDAREARIITVKSFEM